MSADSAPDSDDPRPNAKSRVADWLNALGRPVNETLGYIGGIHMLMMATAGWLYRACMKREVRFGRRSLYAQIVRLGVRATTVIVLVSVAIGMILALQMAPPLRDFNQTDKVANIIAIAVVRELGPLISAIVLTGFAGASIAAELGTMVVGEEIEALEAHALNPTRFLVVPRVLATTLCEMVLCVIAMIVAIGSGAVIGVFLLDVPMGIYQTNTIEQLAVADFLTGMWKAAVFGSLIGGIACYNGLGVTGGAAGVGKATTNTVVHSIQGIIFADLLFTAVFYMLGWH